MKKKIKNILKFILQKTTKLKLTYLYTLWKLGIIHGLKNITTNTNIIYLRIILTKSPFHFETLLINKIYINTKRLFAINIWNPNYFILLSTKFGLTIYWKYSRNGGLLLH